jgi:hypothetical protein
MKNAKRIGYLWMLAVALGIGLAVANTPVIASAAPGGSGKGSSSSNSSQSTGASTPHQHPPKKFGSDLRKGGTTSPTVVKAAATSVPGARRESRPTTINQPTAPTVTTAAADPDFITSSHGFFGLFSVTSAADPDDNNFVAFVLRTPLFTDVLTSGTDPEDNLGFGAASTGVAGHTVNTFSSPVLNFSLGVPVTDPFAVLFTSLVRAGF